MKRSIKLAEPIITIKRNRVIRKHFRGRSQCLLFVTVPSTPFPTIFASPFAVNRKHGSSDLNLFILLISLNFGVLWQQISENQSTGFDTPSATQPKPQIGFINLPNERKVSGFPDNTAMWTS